jgi:hypothetical protein
MFHVEHFAHSIDYPPPLLQISAPNRTAVGDSLIDTDVQKTAVTALAPSAVIP